ncbi:MAG: hypothetical protein JXJ17_09110 [Anaerolineae bacterium]|nr:hypothetical protein [Anaerolineae bacterium]
MSPIFDFLTRIFGPLLLVSLTAGVVNLAFRIRIWMRSLQTLRGISNVVPIDVSGETVLPPEEIHPILITLLSLNFKRLGEVQVKLPGHPSPHYRWVLASPAGLTHAEVSSTDGRPMVVFASLFTSPDPARHAAAITSYPAGFIFDEPDYKAHAVGDSLKAAYRHQLTLMMTYRVQMGDPLCVDNMLDFMIYSRIYNSEFGVMFYQPVARKAGLSLIGSLYDVLVAAGVVVCYYLFDLQAALLMAISIPLLLSVFLVDNLLKRACKVEYRPMSDDYSLF